jgi:prephenate dehydrogenase
LRLDKLVVVGVGLIGGSLALALRRFARVDAIVGVGRTQANLAAALRAGIVDRAHLLSGAWKSELGDADVVVIATPVAQLPQLFAAMRDQLGPRTVVTDAGSTKRDAIVAAREHLGDAMRRFVGAHPIAGTEQSGAEAAFAELFDGRNVIVTPTADTDPGAREKVEQLWRACGARIVTMDAGEHDRVFAAVSHLPHVLAAAYVADLAVRPDAGRLFALAGSGFRDFTRIAAGSPELWHDIALANREALVAEIAAFRGALDVLDEALRDPHGDSLRQLLVTASDARRAWLRSRGDA